MSFFAIYGVDWPLGHIVAVWGETIFIYIYNHLKPTSLASCWRNAAYLEWQSASPRCATCYPTPGWLGIGHVVGMTAGNEWMLCEELQVWDPQGSLKFQFGGFEMVQDPLGGGNSIYFFIFTPKTGEMIQFDVSTIHPHAQSKCFQVL